MKNFSSKIKNKIFNFNLYVLKNTMCPVENVTLNTRSAKILIKILEYSFDIMKNSNLDKIKVRL